MLKLSLKHFREVTWVNVFDELMARGGFIFNFN